MTGPLDDVVVIDLTRALAGLDATMLLADLGARVIKGGAAREGGRGGTVGAPVRDAAPGRGRG